MLENFPVGEYREIGERGALGGGMETLSPFPIPCPVQLFHVVVPKLYFFNNKLVT